MKELICITCPKGCHLKVDENNGYSVTGNGCPRGAEYGQRELTNPVRTLTSIVRIEGAFISCCPVKTSKPIPKAKITDVMSALKKVVLTSPVKTGDIVVENVCNTGADWIATRDL